jgi:hypothetical protein
VFKPPVDSIIFPDGHSAVPRRLTYRTEFLQPVGIISGSA